MGSYLEEAFALWLKQEGIGGYEREHEFALDGRLGRRWRFDFAWIEQKVAVEIEGLTQQGGRHQRIGGFLDDAEKYEMALLLGWSVYRVPGPWVATTKRHIWRPQVMITLSALLLSGPTKTKHT